jgi:Flp pilus assembly pilin Flp
MPASLGPATTWIVARLRVGGDRGASIVEYALLVVLIAAVCLGAVVLLGKTPR